MKFVKLHGKYLKRHRDNKFNITNKIMVLYKCERCEKTFDHKGIYDRHVKRKNPCAHVNKIDKPGIDIIVEKLNGLTEKVDKVTKTNIELTKKIEDMEKEMKELKKRKPLTINGDVNCQINILAFGKEDLSFMTDKMKQQILNSGLKGVQKYVEMVHCNKDKPENNNIYISNRKEMDRNIMVFDGNDWKLCNNNYIEELRDKGIEFIEEHYENLKNRNDVNPNIIKMAKRFIDKNNNNNKEGDTFRNKISDDIKTILYNNRPCSSRTIKK